METITLIDNRERWLPTDIENDLKAQAAIDVLMDKDSINAYGCSGQFEEVNFSITWVFNKFLVLVMEGYSQTLVEAFTKIFGVDIAFTYTRSERFVVEWSKQNLEQKEERFKSLTQNVQVSNIQKL